MLSDSTQQSLVDALAQRDFYNQDEQAGCWDKQDPGVQERFRSAAREFLAEHLPKGEERIEYRVVVSGAGELIFGPYQNKGIALLRLRKERERRDVTAVLQQHTRTTTTTPWEDVADE